MEGTLLIILETLVRKKGMCVRGIDRTIINLYQMFCLNVFGSRKRLIPLSKLELLNSHITLDFVES